MLQKWSACLQKRRIFILVVLCTTFPSLSPIIQLQNQHGKSCPTDSTTLSPASPPILPWSLSMLLYHDIMLVSSFCFLAYSSFAVFILLSYQYGRHSPTPPPQSDLPGGHCNCRTGGREVVLFFDFSLIDPCIPYRRDGQETMTQTEVSVPGRRLVPLPSESPTHRGIKGTCQQECPCYKFQLHLTSEMAFQNFTPWGPRILSVKES